MAGEVALRLGPAPRRAVTVLAFPASVLGELGGPDGGPVSLEESGPRRGSATWTEGGDQCRHEFALVAPDPHLSFPAVPPTLTNPGAGFLAALRQVSETASRHETGRGLHRVLLSGQHGRLMGTDGRQLLVQGGFTLPWTGDLLVPRTDVWV